MKLAKDANTFVQHGISFQTDAREVNIPRSDFVFWVATVHFQANIFVFSSRNHPQVYSPLGPLGPTDSRIGIFWALDSFSGTSNIFPLVCTKTLPRPQPPPVAVDTPEAEHPPAIFREETRERTRTRHDLTYNLDPFKTACLSKVQELVTVATEKLVSMTSWSKPKRKNRAQQQHDSYESLYQAELGKKLA
ncbi:MAG: hypothetical protein J3Q66DRAFT_404142 [Benniella sp.]|nr:MAG: hypothetical protein J3Q66DRAFT_404142 [Benniella sp.]